MPKKQVDMLNLIRSGCYEKLMMGKPTNLKQLKRDVENAPDNPWTNFYYGLLLGVKGDLNNAMKHISIALNNSSNNVNLLMRVAMAFWVWEAHDQAFDLFYGLLGRKIDPNVLSELEGIASAKRPLPMAGNFKEKKKEQAISHLVGKLLGKSIGTMKTPQQMISFAIKDLSPQWQRRFLKTKLYVPQEEEHKVHFLKEIEHKINASPEDISLKEAHAKAIFQATTYFIDTDNNSAIEENFKKLNEMHKQFKENKTILDATVSTLFNHVGHYAEEGILELACDRLKQLVSLIESNLAILGDYSNYQVHLGKTYYNLISQHRLKGEPEKGEEIREEFLSFASKYLDDALPQVQLTGDFRDTAKLVEFNIIFTKVVINQYVNDLAHYGKTGEYPMVKEVLRNQGGLALPLVDDPEVRHALVMSYQNGIVTAHLNNDKETVDQIIKLVNELKDRFPNDNWIQSLLDRISHQEF